jgi:5-methylcytosine-specific restriction endonuclease McrA
MVSKINFNSNVPKRKVFISSNTIKITVKKYNHTKINFATLKKNVNNRPIVKQYIKEKLYLLQHNKCNLCKKFLFLNNSENITIDHIIPRYLNGRDNINNYQVLCDFCNKWKTYTFDKILEKKIKNENKSISFNEVVKLQSDKYNSFFGKYD